MGTSNKRPLGPSSDPGLPNRVYDQTGTDLYPNKHVYHSREPKLDRSRSSRITCKTSGSPCFTQLTTRTGLHQLPFRGPQKGGGTPTSHKLETLKHVSALRTLQNGVNQHVEGPFKKRRLSSKDRPEGCVSDDTHLEGSPKIPSLSIPFRVCLSPIWSHKINETSSVNFETKWCSPRSLFRRFSNNGRDTTAHPATCSNNPKLAGRSGICSKLPQIRPHTLSRNRIPRVHSKFSESKLEPPDGQDQESPPKLPEVTGQPCCYSLGISKVLGPSVCLNPGSVSSTIKLSLPPTCKELSSEKKNKNLTKPLSLSTQGPSGSALVEGQPSCLEWKGPSPSTYRPYHQDRCLPQRMPGVTSRVPDCQVFYQAQVLLLMDNVTAVTYINKMGGPHSLLSQLAKDLWDRCLNHNVLLRAQCLPGIQNVQADRESRVFLDSSDWKLNTTIFDHLYQKWGPLNLDLFASRLTFQLDQYVSWRPDPLAIHTDAFTLNWATFRGYAFPPFALIGRCLQQVQSQRVEHLVLVAPVWPAQTWYPLLLELCVDFPLLLPMQTDLC